MNYTEDTLNIFAASATIFERLNQNWDYVAFPTEEDLRHHKHQWAQVLSKENGNERLQRFLEIEQITEEDLKKMLSTVRANDKTVLPNWLEILERTITLYKNGWQPSEALAQLTVTEDGDATAWGTLMLPWVKIYQEEVQQLASCVEEIIHREVYITLERSFLAVLTETANKMLLDKLKNFGQTNLYSSVISWKGISWDDKKYRQFIEENDQSSFVEVLKEFPMLARILSTFTQNIAQAHARFINRMAADYNEIKATLFQNKSIGKVVKIKNSNSDLHKKGESVILLKFESGEKLAYKPKNLGLAQHFNHLIDWLNGQNSPIKLKSTRLINKKEYGWVEYIDFKECESAEEVHQYYLRAGALLCLCYLLEGTDFHYENLIANGAHPVIVDFETILTPRPVVTNKSERSDEEIAQELRSVLKTSLLPAVTTLYGKLVNFGGFGGKVSKDSDRLGYMQQEVNVPHHQGQRYGIAEYQMVLKEGFTTFYHFIETQKAKLLGDQSPLYRLNGIPVRALFRNTFVYGYIRQKLEQPHCLKNGIAFSIQMEALSRALLKPTVVPPSWKVLSEERAAIIHFDVPFFTTTTASTDLKVNEQFRIKQFYQAPSFDAMQELIRNMDETDLLQQIQFIEKAFDLLYIESATDAPQNIHAHTPNG